MKQDFTFWWVAKERCCEMARTEIKKAPTLTFYPKCIPGASPWSAPWQSHLSCPPAQAGWGRGAILCAMEVERFGVGKYLVKPASSVSQYLLPFTPGGPCLLQC